MNHLKTGRGSSFAFYANCVRIIYYDCCNSNLLSRTFAVAIVKLLSMKHTPFNEVFILIMIIQFMVQKF